MSPGQEAIGLVQESGLPELSVLSGPPGSGISQESMNGFLSYVMQVAGTGVQGRESPE